MGFSASWVAVRGKQASSVLGALGLRGTGERDSGPDFPVAGVSLAEGWYLVIANRCNYFADSTLATLSSGAEVVACSVEEHVMVSSASGWKDGSLAWVVCHNAQQGWQHLDTEGELPAGYWAIWSNLLAAQVAAGGAESQVDYLFDVPVELAQAFTGFRHDRATPGDDTPFEKLEPQSR